MKSTMIQSVFGMLVFAMAVMPMANAQNLSFGPVVGVNFASISDVPNAQVKAGLAAGLFLNYSVNEKFGLGIKGLFSQMGTKVENSPAEVNLNYLQIPLSGIYYFGNVGDSFRPKIFLGPYLGLLLSGNDQNGNEILGSDGKGLYKKADVGGQIGVGFNYSLKNSSWLNFDAGYGASFVNITDHSTLNHRNRAFFVSLGYSFPLNM